MELNDLLIERLIKYPESVFNKFNAHSEHKDKNFNEIKIFASIFRKKFL